MRHGRAAVGFLILLGCAGEQVLPGGEGGRWRELQSEHFLLRTELPLAEAQAAVAALERTQAALLTLAWPGTAPPPGRQTVYLLGGRGDLPAAEDQRAGIRPGHDGLESVWVAWGPLAEWRERQGGSEPPFRADRDRLLDPRAVMVGGELPGLLADRLARHFLGESPRWLLQGLTWYLSGVRVEGDGRSAALGPPTQDALRRARAGEVLPAAEVVADGAAPEPPLDPDSHRRFMAFNRTSWLLIHYLVTSQKEAFAEYQRRLALGASPGHALSALRNVRLERVDPLLQGYARNLEWPARRVTLPPVGPVPVHALDESESLLARAQLLLAWRAPGYDGGREAAAVVERTLRLAPALPAARRDQVLVAPRERRLSLARSLALADPNEWRSWVLLAEALPDGPSSMAERTTALSRARDLSPRSARVVLGQARLLFASGQGGAARPVLAEALKLDPYDAEGLRLLALLQQGLGRCREAAFAWTLAHGAGGLGRDELRARLADLGGCVDRR